MNIIRPPNNFTTLKKLHYSTDPKNPCVYLAGSSTGKWVFKWQDYVIIKMKDLDGTILDPNIDGCNPSLCCFEERKHDPKFYQQVSWEVAGLEYSDHILMHFEDYSESPISLLELGLYASSAKLIISCGPKFYKYGNIEMVCENYQIPLCDSLDKGILELRTRIRDNNKGY